VRFLLPQPAVPGLQCGLRCFSCHNQRSQEGCEVPLATTRSSH
jgi:hypothetical protein